MTQNNNQTLINNGTPTYTNASFSSRNQPSLTIAWCKIRSVLNPKLSPYNYPTLVSRDKGGIKIRSVTMTEKLKTLTSQMEGVFTNEIENNLFDEAVKTDVDAELDQPIARASLNFQKFDPDIHPDRIRFVDACDATLPQGTGLYQQPHSRQTPHSQQLHYTT